MKSVNAGNLLERQSTLESAANAANGEQDRGQTMSAAQATDLMDGDAQPFVHLREVSKHFRANRGGTEIAALDGVSLSAAKGSITAIIGRSGAGKSTLIRLINGLEKPSSGNVIVNGMDIAPLSERELRQTRRSIGMIFQHFNLLSSRTVYENIALPLEIAGTSKAEIRKKVTPLLDLVGLANMSDRYPSQLSGGQKQRVGIARALATSPSLLLSDEATSALDPETTRSVLALLRQINRELGLTIILITHEMEVVKSIADYVAVIDHGKIVEQGTTASTFSAPQHEVTRTLLASLPSYRIPENLAKDLRPQNFASAKPVLRVSFLGADNAHNSNARLNQVLGENFQILSGALDDIGDQPFGSFIIKLPDPIQSADQILAELASNHISAEVLGYVA